MKSQRISRLDKPLRFVTVRGQSFVVCPRCNRPAIGWPLMRGDRCAPKNWGHCLRWTQDVVAWWCARQSGRFVTEESIDLSTLAGDEVAVAYPELNGWLIRKRTREEITR